MAKAKLKWTKTTLAHDGWFWYRDAERSAVLLPLILALILLTGCISSPTLYPGTGQTPDLQEPGVTVLGEVTACQGAWCKKDDGGYESQLSLPAPPPAYTYQSALAKKAAKQYGIPESDVVIGEMKVGYYAEMIGTIRGWKADAPVGKSLKRSGSTSASSVASASPMTSPSTWTTAKPGKRGWYWMKVEGQRSRIVEVADDPPHGLYLLQTGTPLADIPEHDRTWAGPIEEPLR